ncbi:hypothetical protein V8E36_003256 [Tilletia maclaganii]
MKALQTHSWRLLPQNTNTSNGSFEPAFSSVWRGQHPFIQHFDVSSSLSPSLAVVVVQTMVAKIRIGGRWWYSYSPLLLLSPPPPPLSPTVPSLGLRWWVQSRRGMVLHHAEPAKFKDETVFILDLVPRVLPLIVVPVLRRSGHAVEEEAGRMTCILGDGREEYWDVQGRRSVVLHREREGSGKERVSERETEARPGDMEQGGALRSGQGSFRYVIKGRELESRSE